MIPEGAMLMYNTYSLHMDPAHWKDPQNFRPDRCDTGEDGMIYRGSINLSCGRVIAWRNRFLGSLNVCEFGI